MKVCRSEEELRTAIASSHFASELLIQEYIDKEYDLLLLGCRLQDGKVLIPGIFKKERWFMQDGSFGVISTQVNQYFDQLENVRRFVESLNYTGPFSIEFGVKDGKAYFYEINLRNDGTSHYFHHASVFMPYWYSLSCGGCLTPADLVYGNDEYYFIDEFGDVANLFSSDLSLLQWFKDIRRARAYKYYESNDKVPFLFLVPKQILSVGYRILKEIQGRCRKKKVSV